MAEWWDKDKLEKEADRILYADFSQNYVPPNIGKYTPSSAPIENKPLKHPGPPCPTCGNPTSIHGSGKQCGACYRRKAAAKHTARLEASRVSKHAKKQLGEYYSYRGAGVEIEVVGRSGDLFFRQALVEFPKTQWWGDSWNDQESNKWTEWWVRIRMKYLFKTMPPPWIVNKSKDRDDFSICDANGNCVIIFEKSEMQFWKAIATAVNLGGEAWICRNEHQP